MKERRDKGLCYHCDSKWNPDHKCPNLKLYTVDGTKEFMEIASYEEENEGQPVVDEVIEVETCEERPNISLHAITGSVTSRSVRTMRVKGSLHNQDIVVLIDSGSTHNFVDPAIVKSAHLPIDPRHKLSVAVANGERNLSEGEVKNEG